MTQFVDMPLSAEVQKRLAANQFTIPTPVQSAAIPHILAGKDVLATAQTGTGKTLAFLLPVIERMLAGHGKAVQTLVLVPTRELAMQVHKQYELLRGKSLPTAALVIGGVPEARQIESLKKGSPLVVATPGRLQDFLDRRLTSLSQVEVLVLDEADRMLDMGFLPSIRRIAAVLPRKRQTLCFSATLEASVAGLVHDYMQSPVRVEIGSTLKPVESVQLQAYEVTVAEKYEALRHLLYEENGQTLIFARTKRRTERLAKDLVRDGFSAAMIHGDRTQSQRTGALAGFDDAKYKVLVATDVASRGIHVRDVAHVINYDLPTLPEDFIHRVGRTGRAGAQGRSTSLVSYAELGELKNIERTLKLNIERKDFRPNETAAPPRPQRNTLQGRTLRALPGEVFA